MTSPTMLRGILIAVLLYTSRVLSQHVACTHICHEYHEPIEGMVVKVHHCCSFQVCTMWNCQSMNSINTYHYQGKENAENLKNQWRPQQPPPLKRRTIFCLHPKHPVMNSDCKTNIYSHSGMCIKTWYEGAYSGRMSPSKSPR